MLERDAQARFKPQDCQDQVGDQRDPNLRHDRVLRGAQEGLDSQVLCDGFEEQLNLPPLFVNLYDRHLSTMDTNTPLGTDIVSE
jgi:hypothetical protein